MGAITRLTIDLPDDLANSVREGVASGRYASESEVIQEGIRALLERDEPEFDEATERWLRTEVAQTYDAVKAGRAEGISAETLLERLADARERRKSAK